MPGLQLGLQREIYRPGEALIVNLNIPQPDARLAGLNSESLEFWLVKTPGDAQRVWPVAPERDAGYAVETARTFVFTEATRSKGGYELMAGIRRPSAAGMEAMPVTWSNVSRFTVEGERLFERDYEGMITKEEAEKLARDYLSLDGGTKGSGQLVSVIDGLKTWQIVFRPDGASEVVWVNPYLGAVHTVQPGASNQTTR